MFGLIDSIIHMLDKTCQCEVVNFNRVSRSMATKKIAFINF